MADFIHVFHPPAQPGAPILLLLHGTGGNEHALLPLANMLLPGAGVLSPRGQVLENGMPRFFRRLEEGVFDIPDLKRRIEELADFITETAETRGFSMRQVIAAGFSNGANAAGALLLLRPEVIGSAILFRAMVPLVPDVMPAIQDTRVLISNGRVDPLVSVDQTEQLVSLLQSAGADVTLEWQNGGHELTQQDVTAAREWLTAPRS